MTLLPERRSIKKRPDSAVPMAGCLTPYARKRLATLRTQAIEADTVLCDKESVSANDGCAAMMAASVLPFTDLAGEVAGIHVFQSRLLPIFDDAHQVFGGGSSIAVGHFVIGMKRRHVP